MTTKALLASMERLACHVPRHVVTYWIDQIQEQIELENQLDANSNGAGGGDDADDDINDTDTDSITSSEDQATTTIDSAGTVRVAELRATLTTVTQLLDDYDDSDDSDEDNSDVSDSRSSESATHDLDLELDLAAQVQQGQQRQARISGLVRRTASVGSHDSSPSSQAANRAVSKLRQGRLSRQTSLASDAASMNSRRSNSTCTGSVTLQKEASTRTTTAARPAPIPASQHQAATLFVDISQFTKLASTYGVETLSKTVNLYFDKIHGLIKQFGGEIQKFAGDAILAQWNANRDLEDREQAHGDALLLATACAAQLVKECADFQVVQVNARKKARHKTKPNKPMLLNLHCAVGFGTVWQAHVGNHQRRELLVFGDAVHQVTRGMEAARQGQVVASPQALDWLGNVITITDDGLFTRLDQVFDRDNGHPAWQVLALKDEHYFVINDPKRLQSLLQQHQTHTQTHDTITAGIAEWSTEHLLRLQQGLASYVHPVVVADELAMTDAMSPSNTTTNNTAPVGLTQAEVRDVFTMFLNPILPMDIGDCITVNIHNDPTVLELLQSIMVVCHSEVTRFHGQLRQFIIDDKGLTMIANFGCRGSAVPNLVQEQALPCIHNLKMLLRSELNLECKVGATYGKAYCGIVGGKSRHEFTILGPSVNLASRLSWHEMNPGILVDDAVKMHAGERDFIQALQPIQAKGYSNPIPIFQPVLSQRKTWQENPDKFVERNAEVKTLQSMAERFVSSSDEPRTASSSKLVFISGPYGIGKSYLLRHAAQRIEDLCKRRSSSHLFTRHIFNDVDSIKPFSIIQPIFQDLLRKNTKGLKEITEFGHAGPEDMQYETEEVEKNKLYIRLLQICLEAKIPLSYVEVFCGLIFSNRLSDIDAFAAPNLKMTEWDTVAGYLVRAYTFLSNEYDLVLMALDDVLGMDEMSLRFAEKLCEKAKNILIVMAGRTEHDLNIDEESHIWQDIHVMELSPMDESDILTLTCERLDEQEGPELTEEIAHTVYLESQGNPLLACEILQALYEDTDALAGCCDDRYQVLVNRLDSLPPLVRWHLYLAAILGYSFDITDMISVLEKYHDTPESEKSSHADSVKKSLKMAVHQGFLMTNRRNKSSYRFSHPLWKETITKQILEDWKQEIQTLVDVADRNAKVTLTETWHSVRNISALNDDAASGNSWDYDEPSLTLSSRENKESTCRHSEKSGKKKLSGSKKRDSSSLMKETLKDINRRLKTLTNFMTKKKH